MAGNVGEFVSDWYGEDYYALSPYQNPAGPEGGPGVVIRGGSWTGYYVHVRTVLRSYNYVGGNSIHTGFRCHGCELSQKSRQPLTELFAFVHTGHRQAVV